MNKKKFDRTTQVTINDGRKLKCGSIIRRFSIDEIPQLFNVLFGDMSIVGPRPHMVEHDIKYSRLFMNYLKEDNTIQFSHLLLPFVSSLKGQKSTNWFHILFVFGILLFWNWFWKIRAPFK